MRSTGIAKDLALERQLQLPPGFRFNPTDEELVVHYLCKMAASQPFAVPIIAEVDIYRFDPWDLPEKALCGSKEWYFFSPRDRKYPNGSRPNRSAGSGYWKATGIDKPISRFGSTQKVGVKKALVFYTGKAPQGVKTDWIMHEYRLADSASKAAKRKGSQRLDDWVLCRIYHKTSGARRPAKETRNKSFLKAAAASLPEPGEAEQINLERSDSFEESKMEEDTQTNTIACCEPEQASETASMPEARYSNDSPAALPALLSSSPGSAHNLHGGEVLQARLKEVVTGHAAGGGSSSCSDAPCGWSEECSSNQSPGGSVGDEEGLRGEEENKMGWLWWLSSELRGEEAVTESGHLPISYEDPLASPYGRFLVEPLHYAEGDGWYFTSLAADYVQRID